MRKWTFRQDLDAYVNQDGKTVTSLDITNYPLPVYYLPYYGLGDSELNAIYDYWQLKKWPDSLPTDVGFKSWLPDSFVLPTLIPAEIPHNCGDHMKEYIGIIDRYSYCTVCDKKDKK